MKLSIKDRKPKTKTKRRGQRKKHPDIWDPMTSQFTHAVRDYAETARRRASESMANFPGRQSTKFTEYYTRGGREESTRRSRQFREERLHKEHNQEAHRWEIWTHTDGGRLISTEDMIQQHGNQYMTSGMEASKKMKRATAESWSKS